jgi:hypothetical protein
MKSEYNGHAKRSSRRQKPVDLIRSWSARSANALHEALQRPPLVRYLPSRRTLWSKSASFGTQSTHFLMPFTPRRRRPPSQAIEDYNNVTSTPAPSLNGSRYQPLRTAVFRSNKRKLKHIHKQVHHATQTSG